MVLAVFGAGGNGRSMFREMEHTNNKLLEKPRWSEIIFVDDVTDEKVVSGARVLRMDEVKNIYSRDEIEFLITLGEPANRDKVAKMIKESGYSLMNYINPTAMCSQDFTHGEGIVAGRCHLSDNVAVGENVYISEFVVLGHDVRVGNNVVISPNVFVGGYTEIGDNCFIAAGATIRDRVKIGEGAVVAPGAAVFKDVPAGHTAIGNPARNMKHDGPLF